MKKKLLAVIMTVCLLGMSACGQENQPAAGDEDALVSGSEVTGNDVEIPEEPSEEPEETPELYEGPRQLVVYFGNWIVVDQGGVGEVSALPWDKVTCINHAFWKIQPDEDGNYKIVSTEPFADLEDQSPSEWLKDKDVALHKNHFGQYAYYSELYPDVDVMISIGGWNCSGYFSEMALTEESRKTFIDSCIDLMNEYEWIDGIDVDWEYPGCYRTPDSELDEGCPVAGVDKENYTLLLKEMREAFDKEFGEGTKKLTVCLPVASRTLFAQDVQSFHPYVDMLNLMAYDMNGAWSGVTGHQAFIYGSGGADTIVQYLLKIGVPGQKINLGTGYYCRGWGGIEADENGNVMGQKNVGISVDNLGWYELKLLELQAVEPGTPGFHMGWDEEAIASYLWNDDPESALYQSVVSYDNERSIAAKAEYVKENGLGGMMVWASYYDCIQDGSPLTSLMSQALGIFDGKIPEYTGEGVKDAGIYYDPEDYK